MQSQKTFRNFFSSKLKQFFKEIQLRRFSLADDFSEMAFKYHTVYVCNERVFAFCSATCQRGPDSTIEERIFKCSNCVELLGERHHVGSFVVFSAYGSYQISKQADGKIHITQHVLQQDGAPQMSECIYLNENFENIPTSHQSMKQQNEEAQSNSHQSEEIDLLAARLSRL